MQLICFHGQHSSGKDSSADAIIEQDSWNRMSFADPVKNIFCQAFNVTREFIEKWKRIDTPPPNFTLSVRKGLQLMGDNFRNIMPNVWIDIAFRNPFTKPTTFTDGRYLNEAKVIHKHKGINVILWRPGYENSDSNKSEAEIYPIVRWCVETNQNGWIRKDSGPEGVEYYDYFLRNDGNLDNLREKVIQFKKDLC